MNIQNKTAGLEFPIILETGSSSLSSGINIIKSSLKIIISWPIRTRYFNGEFGSRIDEVLENQNDNILISIIRQFIIDSITKWEKRIELISVEIFRPTSEKLTINLVYRVKELDIQDTLFYDFYIN